jgi:hypothetical protein
MNPLTTAVADWGRIVARSWDRFWFTPAQPHTLALIRILGGGMLLYTHLVWTLGLGDFLGRHSWVNNSAALLLDKDASGTTYAWSYLWYIDSPLLLWTVHLAALVVFFLLTVGWHTRVVSILACVITLAYCHRLSGALFGLDQVNAMLATYLMLGRCGAVYSVDRLLAVRRGETDPPAGSVGTNVAIRLIQLQMCIIYLFGGIGKMRGELWWDGSAVWFALANLEYQSIEMTWMVHWPWLIALLTHVTVFWETFYCFLIWPKITRPICLAIAVAVHGGIALFLGMITFGLAMIIANIAFIEPEFVRALVSACRGTLARFIPQLRSEAAAVTVSQSVLPPTRTPDRALAAR